MSPNDPPPLPQDQPSDAIPLTQNPWFIGVLLVVFFPVGLYFLWTHPNWSKNKKIGWTGAWGCLMVIGMIGTSVEEQAQMTRNKVDRNESLRGKTQKTKATTSALKKRSKRLRLGMTPDEVISIMGQPDFIEKSHHPATQGQLLFFRYNGGEGQFGFNFMESVFVHYADKGRPTGRVTLIQ